jgi:hypothetical protein
MAVQAEAGSNWPDGTREHSLGVQEFLPAYVHSHDVKRGASIELAMSGTFLGTQPMG